MDKIVIEFPKPDALQERRAAGFIATFGVTLRKLLKKMFGGEKIPIIVKGTPNQVRAFAKALVHEKNYYKMYKKYGLDNPRTYRSKYRLKRAIHEFERKTGIIWPLKFR